MPFLEFTRVLPKNKKVKWSVNTNNVVYFQEPTSADPQVGCTLVNAAGIEIDVVESYQDVQAKLSKS